MLPLVLFLTDGLPTVGVRDESAIRTAAAKANVHRRRLFTFGVGYDVNAPLLSHLAQHSRAVSTFVLPDEIVRLSIEFGILTEYTAFLAREGTDLALRDDVLRQATANLATRAQQTRSGVGAVNQSINTHAQQTQVTLNRSNAFYDENMNRVQVARVQQVADQAFFQQGSRWVDGRMLNDPSPARPDRTVTVGSPEFMELVDRLAAQNCQGILAMSGEIPLSIDGETVLIKAE
jgi:hypothetical protein